MNPQEEPIKEDIAIPAYGVTDPQEKRKIFESIFSINIITKIRCDLISMYIGDLKETNEKDENDYLIIVYKNKGMRNLWETFIYIRNFLAHPYNYMNNQQFKLIITNVKRLIKFIREIPPSKEFTIAENLIKILRQILTKLESLNCLVNISLQITASQVISHIPLSSPSTLIDWKLQPRKTPTNRVSEYL